MVLIFLVLFYFTLNENTLQIPYILHTVYLSGAEIGDSVLEKVYNSSDWIICERQMDAVI